jgi:hypothetical protein
MSASGSGDSILSAQMSTLIVAETSFATATREARRCRIRVSVVSNVLQTKTDKLRKARLVREPVPTGGPNAQGQKSREEKEALGDTIATTGEAAAKHKAKRPKPEPDRCLGAISVRSWPLALGALAPAERITNDICLFVEWFDEDQSCPLYTKSDRQPSHDRM